MPTNMSDLDSATGTPIPDAHPPSKRRRVLGDDTNGSPSSTPRYSSPDSPVGQDKGKDNSESTKPLPARSLSIRRGRPPSRSLSRSPAGVQKKIYYSSSRSSQSRDISPLPARTPDSQSRSRSHSEDSHSEDSRSRSRSRSRSQSHSRSRSSSSRRSTPRSRSRSPRHRRSASASSSSSTSSSDAAADQHGRRRRRRRRPALRTNYRRCFSMRGHAAAISQVRISPDGRWIASASADGTARIWSAETGAHIASLVGHMAGVSCLAWSPDSGTLATGSDDKAIRLWDRVTAEPAHAVPGNYYDDDGDDETAVDGSGTNGDANSNGVVRMRARARVRAAAAVRRGVAGAGAGAGGSGGARGSRMPLLGHHNYVYCLAFSPKGNILASGSYDEAVFLWDVRAGRLMRSLPAHSDPVSGIDFCRDGTLVVSCSTDGLIRIWDTATGQCLRTLLLLNEDNPAVANVCFSPNGRYVLAFNLDSCIRLWDYIPHPSTVKKTYQGHRNTSFSIGGCFGVVDGQSFVAAASEDGDVVLWDVLTKDVVQRLRGAHDGVCFWVDVCGDTMVSCGGDGRIVVFRNEQSRSSRRKEVEKEKEKEKENTKNKNKKQKKEDRDRSTDGVEGVGEDAGGSGEDGNGANIRNGSVDNGGAGDIEKANGVLDVPDGEGQSDGDGGGGGGGVKLEAASSPV